MSSGLLAGYVRYTLKGDSMDKKLLRIADLDVIVSTSKPTERDPYFYARLVDYDRVVDIGTSSKKKAVKVAAQLRRLAEEFDAFPEDGEDEVG